MKKSLFISLFLLLLTLPSAAQVKVGYYSNDAVMHTMPAYVQVQKDLQQLRAQYDKETQRAQDEFNAKYEEFLESYNSLAPSIRRKRQVELQQLMESNVKFREEAQRLLRQAEQDAMLPLQQIIEDAVGTVAEERGCIIVLNTDSNACPYINPTISEDITSYVSNALK